MSWADLEQELAEPIHGRCRHGFVKGLCVVFGCESAETNMLAPQQRRRGQGELLLLPGVFQCRACGLVKALSEFYANRSSRRGHQSRCKECDNRWKR